MLLTARLAATWDKIRGWAAALKKEIVALRHAALDPRVPWLAKLLIVLVVAYALSPIDLIPDFIPVLGLIDDLLILPLGIALAVRLLPPPLMEEFRDRAALAVERRWRWRGLAIVFGLWVGIAALLYVLIAA